MSKKSELLAMMKEDLPPIGQQKRLNYRTSKSEVIGYYKLINKLIFNNQLQMPDIEVSARCRKYWGICIGNHEKVKYRQTHCKIKLMDKWFCRQWLLTTLAHEMCHQYQWDILGDQRINEGKERIMSHGKSFYLFREKLAMHGISLKRSHGQKRWFKTQNLFKC